MQARTSSDNSPFGTTGERCARQVDGRPRPRFNRVLVVTACVLIGLPAIALASAGSGPAHDARSQDREGANEGPEESVEVCHVPPGNPAAAHTILVNRSVLKAHLAHGDEEGACAEVEAEEDHEASDGQEDAEDQDQAEGDDGEGGESDTGGEGQDEDQNESDDEETIEICHVPPGNAEANHTIQINASALQAHLDHGDHEGACAESDDAEDNDDGAHGEENQEPVASFSSACTGLACTFDASSSSDPDGNITAWNWSFGDGSGASDSQASHVYLSDGTYNVTLTVTDDDGASSAASHLVNISSIEDAVPEILNAAPSPLFEYDCIELGCTFDASNSSDPDGNITEWGWSFGDGTNATGEAVNHTYAAPGSYDVTLDVADDRGAISSSLRQITVAAAASVAGGGGGGSGGGSGGSGNGSGGGGSGGSGGDASGGPSPSSSSDDPDASDDEAPDQAPVVDGVTTTRPDRQVRPPMPSDDADDEGPEENRPPAEPLVVAQAAPSSEDASGGRDGHYAPVQAPALAPWYLFQAAGAPAVSFGHAFPAKGLTAVSLLGHRAMEQGVPKGKMFYR